MTADVTGILRETSPLPPTPRKPGSASGCPGPAECQWVPLS